MALRKIIIDTDPGQDDAIAILLALASPAELEVLGVTAVAGNVALDLTQANARKVCELAGRRDVKVFAGCPRPFLRPLHTAEEVHGRTGLDGPTLPEPTMPLQSEHAVDWMVRTVMSNPPDTITLCTLGPLTNVAAAVVMEPRIVPRLREIVMMGGGYFTGGNATPAAEFNIFVDPHAADVVFRAGAPIVMMPLDVTHKALTTSRRLARIRALDTPVALAAAAMLEFYDRYDSEKYGTDGGPLHDPCVIAYLLRPGLFTGREVNVQIEVEGRWTTGMTVMDWWRRSGRKPNATVMHAIDADGFYDLLIERLARL